MDAPVKMIVGLGNPGRTYEDTRHNAGFMVVDRLAAGWGAVFKTDRQRKCELRRPRRPAGEARHLHE